MELHSEEEKAIEMSEIMKPLSAENGRNRARSKEEVIENGVFTAYDDIPNLDEVPQYRYGSIDRCSRWLPPALREFFFPSHLPEALQLARAENIAVPFCYLVVGLLQGQFRTKELPLVLLFSLAHDCS